MQTQWIPSYVTLVLPIWEDLLIFISIIQVALDLSKEKQSKKNEALIQLQLDDWVVTWNENQGNVGTDLLEQGLSNSLSSQSLYYQDYSVVDSEG